MAAAGDDLSRRGFLERLLSLAAVPVVGRAVGAAEMVDDPYAEVDWSSCQHLHSMSHQHQGQSAASLDLFYAMGYRHLAFSNYYPSAPTIPPAEWLAAHPDALECANAEHHSFTDSSAHCNALGSRTRTGAGWSAKVPTSSPHEHTFSGLNVFRAERPWEGVYRLDLKLAAQGSAQPAAEVSLAGGLLAQNTGELIGDGSIAAMAWDARRGSILFRATAAEARVTLRFDPATTRVTQFRLMQGSNRPWRDVFRACLEGELIDGQRVGGLEFADGGGMTINHPTGTDLDPYLAMLDFDPRVLGIEVFNHLTDGFGAARTTTAKPPQHFVELWDRILASGRRCLGFFVKDHRTCAVGRNVLLVPPAAGRSREHFRALGNLEAIATHGDRSSSKLWKWTENSAFQSTGYDPFRPPTSSHMLRVSPASSRHGSE
ncbi:MAG: hypothetical protein HUU35_11770 [Armatimonadetes bacterium]|nr:hypothetical protein [Armatimonadota bacterium]